jgi:hypothetical protein
MKIKAIALGVIVDWVGTLVLCLPIGVVVAVVHLSKGGKPENLASFLYTNVPLMLMFVIVGFVPVVAGGAVTAHIAKERRIWNAFLMGLATSLFAIPFSISRPLWYNIIAYSLMTPCAMLGGWIVEKRKQGQQNPPPLPRGPQTVHSEGEG